MNQKKWFVCTPHLLVKQTEAPVADAYFKTFSSFSLLGNILKAIGKSSKFISKFIAT